MCDSINMLRTTDPSEHLTEIRNPGLNNSELLSLDLNHSPASDLLLDHYELPTLKCLYCFKIFPSAQSLGGHQNAHPTEIFAAKKQLLKPSQRTQSEIIRSAKARGIVASSSSASSSNTSASGPKSFNYNLRPPPRLLGRYNPPAHLKVKPAYWPFHRFERSPPSVGDRQPVEGYSKFLRKKKTKPTAEKSPHPPAGLILVLNPPPAEKLGSVVSAMEVGTLNGDGEGRIPPGLDLSLKL